MFLKCLVVAGAMVFATAASAQQSSQNQNPPTQSQAQPPANNRTNAQGETPSNSRTMQEKDTGLMNQSGGAPGATGSTGTQSGTPPAAPAPQK